MHKMLSLVEPKFMTRLQNKWVVISLYSTQYREFCKEGFEF